MVIGSISYTVVSLYASTATVSAPSAAAPAPAPAPVTRPSDDDERTSRHHHRGHGHHGHHRGGGIVDAVRTALRELTAAPGGTTPTPAAPAPVAPAPAPQPAVTAAPAASADDFALQLWRALRDAASTGGNPRTERRYGDLPQRLETLASSLEQPSSAAASSLVDAFGAMLNTLRGGTASAGDARSMLASFLHRIADVLGGGASAGGAAPTGQLVNTSA